MLISITVLGAFVLKLNWEPAEFFCKSDVDPAAVPRVGGGLAIFIYSFVRMKGQIQTQKYGFTVNFAPKIL